MQEFAYHQFTDKLMSQRMVPQNQMGSLHTQVPFVAISSWKCRPVLWYFYL